MALDFPNAPTNGQVYTDTGTGEQWAYEAATNSWTSKGLVNTSGGLQYKGSVDITAAPPTGVQSGWQYSVGTGGTANAGYGPGVTGTVSKGAMVLYNGTGWLETSHAVPDATAAVKGVDLKLWKRTGTTLAPETANDVVEFSAGTAALPGLTPAGDPDTGIYSPGADQLAISTGGTGRLFVDASGNVGVGTTTPGTALDVKGATKASYSIASGSRAAYVSPTGGLYSYFASKAGTINAITDNSGTAGTLVFATGTERARIDSSGNFGVGVTSVATTGLGNVIRNKAGTGLGAAGYFAEGANSDTWFGIYSGTGTSDSAALIYPSTGSLRIATSTGVNVGGYSEKIRLDSSGRLLVGTSSNSGGALLQVNGDRIRVATAKTPASATDTGTAGEICWDASYIYVCTATNTWKRTAIGTW